jgi:large subunit ribosomal protein L4
MDLTIMNIAGKETGQTVTLDESVFGIEPNDHAIYLDVKQYLANNRAGTHKAKERSEVTGSTRKLKKQKGSGSARFGDIKNPLFRSGGRVFGPRPRDYSFKLNKKVKALARLSALSYKAKTNQLVVLEDFNFELPKTKEFFNFQKNLNLDNKKSLLVLKERNNNIYLSSRNLQNSKVVTLSELNTYDIMNATTLLFVKSSLDVLQGK